MKNYLFLITAVALTILTYLNYSKIKSFILKKTNINIISGTSCPSLSPYTTHPNIPANNITYPATVRSNDDKAWIMFTGGIASQLPAYIQATLPPGHIRFPVSQEEIWTSNSTDLETWSQILPSFTLLPETPVVFKQNSSYQSAYPDAFKLGCVGLTADTQCNAQINDPTAIRLNGSIYLYFTILENYRWYFGTVDGISAPLVNGNPSKPELQNIHSIGLAVSADDGKNWAFVDKVVREHEIDSDGNPILGAWAPSAIVTSGNNVDIYFHDAFASKQYVAHLAGGASLTTIEHINKADGKDGKFRANLDVIKNGNYLEAVYNDATFGVTHTFFTGPEDFGLCPETVIVEGKNPDATKMWPTPHQIIDGDKVHLYFSNFTDRSYMPHWSRTNTVPSFIEPSVSPSPSPSVSPSPSPSVSPSPSPSVSPSPDASTTIIPGDLNFDGVVNIEDYSLIITDYGTLYNIIDYSNIITNYLCTTSCVMNQ